MIRILALMEAAFSIWMLVDAIRRGAAFYWYLIILLPFGEWAYFFSVKIHDPEFASLRQSVDSLFRPKASLEQLRYRQEQSPSFSNTVRLGKALYDRKVYSEALELFERAVRLDGEACEALFGRALTRIGLNRFEGAIEDLQRVIALQPSFEDYEAFPNLAHALSEAGRRDEAIGRLEELVQASPRLNHRMLLAHYLSREGRSEEARRQLEAGLKEYEHAPRFLKRRQRAWARQAKKMLQETAMA